ncbi:prepilin-type N-terminal cleavage/methylation domain-containing protein [Acetobacterium tundrae]|uniref:Prepilin-type N-terminal cleavage/methylation domain-containing protein n=1 Tax=Acetobacterium tundrae TaxID=132932 RepID=A0ABR6WJW9_9FIRM|nr:prepilin-type N-terminal cleavage/methylation domain-containing protein [Acetobacterium tundrae]MBC3796775.1 prepilin-type N-terminal cleavage/methylation domain-containing protein [Acetobacterium tundrae]
MKKIIDNQRGVTLIETVVATAIIAILLVTLLGTLLFGQKMIVFTDTKNNAAAQAQNLVDGIMTQLGASTLPNDTVVDGATKMATSFDDSKKTTNPKQYYINEVTKSGTTIGYNIFARVYYNNGDSYVDLKAFAKKGGVFN